MKYVKFLAMVMSVLIVTLPFTSGAISSVKVTGQDGINGIIREQDTIVYEVTVDGNITPDLLKLNNNIIFDSCANQGGQSVCQLTQTTDAAVPLPVIPWVITEFEKIGNLTRQIDARSGIVAVDKTGPEIIVLSKEISHNKITISFKAQDYGFARGDTTSCSGLAHIEITDDGGSLTKSIPVPTNECSFSGTTSESKESFSEGHHIISATAFDRFEISGNPRTVEFDIDKTPPTIGQSSGALDQFGAPMTFIGPSPQRMNVKVQIDGGDLDYGSVKGDFSSLGFENGIIQGSCAKINENSSMCSFFINAHATAGGDFAYKITAADKDGNSVTQDSTLSLTFDGTGPVISAVNLGIVSPDGFTYLLPDKNQITATVSDEGIGFDKTTIFLDLSGIGLGNKVQPSDCTNGICTWSNVPNNLPSSYLGTVKASTESKDFLGNPLTLPSLTIDVKSDRDAPQFISSTITPVGTAFSSAYQNLIKTGDILLITVKVREPVSQVVTATLDFSSYFDPSKTNDTNGSSSLVSGVCSVSGAVYTCTFQTPAINIEGHIVSTAKLNVTDLVGNSLLYDIPIEVLELEKGTPDYWKHVLTCSPNPVDRQVTTLVQQRVFCHIALDPKKDSPRTLFLALASDLHSIGTNQKTGNDTNTDTDLIESAELINNEENSTDPYIVLTLAKKDMKIDTLKFNVTLQIVSQAESKVTGVPEEELIDGEIQFYDMPLGELSLNLKSKIDESVSQAKILGDWVGVLNKILTYGKKLCELIGTFIKIYGIMNGIYTFFHTLHWADGIPVIGQSAKTARIELGAANEGVGYLTKLTWGGEQVATGGTFGSVANGINLFCKAFSCRLYYGELLGAKEGSVGAALTQWQVGVLDVANKVQTLGLPGFKTQEEERGVVAYGEGGRSAQRIFDDINKGSIGATGYEKIPPLHSGVLSPENSLVLSTLTLCIPGIIFNLQKLRQVYCIKADCYKNKVPKGMPPKACQDLQAYQTCKYVTGELFQLIPLAGLVNYVDSLIKRMISDPFALVDTSLNLVCHTQIITDTPPASLCLVHDLFGMTADVYQDLSGLGESWSIKGDYCENI